ncbi:MAG: type II toxin-antitoxin system VapC family toxin [Desulfotomaculales bacterium]
MGREIVVDTSIIVAHFRAKGKKRTAFEQVVEEYEKVYISAITAWEIEYGALRAGRPSDLTDILRLVEVLPFGLGEARAAAKIYAELKTRNQDIGVRDTLIAGTCLGKSVPLMTANAEHFRRVSGMEVFEPHGS